jgi:hypothetical protein
MQPSNKRRDFLKKAIPAFLLPASWQDSREHSFSADRPRFRFAVASDGHFGQDKTPYQMYYRDIVRWLNWEKEERGLDLAFFNGDLIHDQPEFLPQVKKQLDQLRMPYYVCRGNHDMVSRVNWESVWGYPTNYAFSIGDYGFILGDTSNQQGEYLCADTAWLASQLNQMKEKKHIFVLLHISQSDWVTNGVSCPAVMDMLVKHKRVKAVFHGHDHQEDDCKMADKTPFLYSGHMGGSWGVEYKGYRIVELLAGDDLLTYQMNYNAQAKLYKRKL